MKADIRQGTEMTDWKYCIAFSSYQAEFPL